MLPSVPKIEEWINNAQGLQMDILRG